MRELFQRGQETSPRPGSQEVLELGFEHKPSLLLQAVPTSYCLGPVTRLLESQWACGWWTADVWRPAPIALCKMLKVAGGSVLLIPDCPNTNFSLMSIITKGLTCSAPGVLWSSETPAWTDTAGLSLQRTQRSSGANMRNWTGAPKESWLRSLHPFSQSSEA